MENSILNSYPTACVKVSAARDVEAGIRSALFAVPVTVNPFSGEPFSVGTPDDPPELTGEAWEGLVDDMRRALSSYMMSCIGARGKPLPPEMNVFAETGGKFSPGHVYKVVVWISDTHEFWFRPLRHVESVPGLASSAPAGEPVRI